MANQPEPPPPDVANITRFQAQRMVGLWAPHDFVVLGVILLSFIVLIVWGVVANPTALQVLCVLAFDMVLTLLQVILLLYRCMTFILEMHAKIELLPPAAARIAAGYLQGKPVEPSSKQG